MAQLSPARRDVPLLEGLPPPHRGKVRDTYDLGNGHLLMVCTDAISVFDFILDALVPMKGAVLNALTHRWLKLLEEHGIKTHFVAAGAMIDLYLPKHLHDNVDLQSRAMVVKKLTMQPVEFIERGYLTGSAWADYKKHNGMVYGKQLPAGMQDGDKLPEPAFTPTTKSEEGDVPMSPEQVRAQYPVESELTERIYRIISTAAEHVGIILADMKLEFGVDENGDIVLGDEVCSPDSCRYWDLVKWLLAQAEATRSTPESLDKEVGRVWAKHPDIGLGGPNKKYSPGNPDDVAKAHQIVVPKSLIDTLTKVYLYVFWRLTDSTLQGYLREVLDVGVSEPRRDVAIIVGSESDLPVVAEALASTELKPHVHVISCHRNPKDLRTFVSRDKCRGAKTIIAAGGWAFALPGVLDALIHEEGLDVRVIGVALGEEGTKTFEAAQLSISELPSRPVVMDDRVGRPYINVDGLRKAIRRAYQGELPPEKPRKSADTKFFVDFTKKESVSA